MTTYTLNITNDATKEKTVQVFQKSPPGQADYQSHAWQALSGPTESGQSFSYALPIAADPTTTGALPGNALAPDQLVVAPGVLLQPTAPADRPSTPAQPSLPPFGTTGQATPYPTLDRSWYVEGSPALAMPTLDLSHGYQPSFSFTLTTPPPAGPDTASATDTSGSEEA